MSLASELIKSAISTYLLYSFLESRILNQGDVVLLAYGGHGFEMLEDSEMIEVKQGPYAGDMDKVRFESVGKEKLEIKY